MSIVCFQVTELLVPEMTSIVPWKDDRESKDTGYLYRVKVRDGREEEPESFRFFGYFCLSCFSDA